MYMLRRILFLYATAIFPLLAAYAQPAHYELKPEVPAKYAYNADSVFKKLMGEKDTTLTALIYREYSESQAYYHDRMLKSGLVYFDWQEIESYLDGLVRQLSGVMGSSRQFRVFLLRSGDVNASAQDNGIIYINIGLLAEMKDEAALVSVLAHELSHAINSDTKKNFVFFNKKRKKLKVRDLLQGSHQNRAFEARADSAGFAAAAELNYNISSCYHAYIKFESEYRRYKSRYQYQDPKWWIALDKLGEDRSISADSLENYLMDHPDNRRRQRSLSAAMAKKNGANSFSGNEAFFSEIKYKARMEQLFIDFSGGAYMSCLENAFYYHLQEQQDKNYLYYATECLRRLILADPGMKRKGFLTDDSKEKIFEEDKGILHDLSFVSLDTVFLLRMKQDAVFGAPEKPFETYLQAYAYFYKASKAAGIPSLPLGTGLFELSRNKKEKGTEQLKKYLDDKENTAYRNFVEANLAGSLMEELKKNTNCLIYIEEPEYYVLINGLTRYSFVESAKITPDVVGQISEKFRRDKAAPVQFLVADSLNIVEYDRYSNLLENLRFFKPAKETELDRGTNGFSREDYWKAREMRDPADPEVLKHYKNFFYLEPGYWDLFRTQNIKAFTSIKPYFYRHKVFGTIFFFEIQYFDPINRVYLYFDQDFAERYTERNVSLVFRRFYDKLRELNKPDAIPGR